MTTPTPVPARDPNRVLIFDTTLRDGEQSPGCSMTQVGKAAGRSRAGRTRGRRHRGGIPGRFPRRLGSRARDRARGARPDHRGPGALQPRRHRQGVDRGEGSCPPSPARVPRHERDPSRAQAQHGEGADHPHGRRRRALRAQPVRGRRVLARGRVAHGAGVPARSGRGGDRGRRDHDQRAGHGGLHRARGIPRGVRLPEEERQGRRSRDLQRPLPQRPRHGGGEQPRRGPSRARARSSARSTASASARATPRSRKS